MKGGVVFSERYAFEVAAFTKLVIRAGSEAVRPVAEIIKNNPALLVNQEGQSIAQVIQAMLAARK